MALSDTYFILRAPGRCPELKRCIKGEEKRFLLELMEHRHGEIITVLTFAYGEPMVQDGPECLLMMDMRHRSRAQQHRQSTDAAFANFKR